VYLVPWLMNRVSCLALSMVASCPYRNIDEGSTKAQRAAGFPGNDLRSGDGLETEICAARIRWQSGSSDRPRQTIRVEAGRVVTRDQLIDAMWGQRPPNTAAHAVHVYVGRLRRVIEPERTRAKRGGVLTSGGPGYSLRLRPDQVDACVFSRQLERARQLESAGELRASVEAMDAALCLWRGTPMTGLDAPFACTERARLAELRLSALERRAEILLRLGSSASLARDLALLAAENPFIERLRGCGSMSGRSMTMRPSPSVS
jgi:hypothetical protein